MRFLERFRPHKVKEPVKTNGRVMTGTDYLRTKQFPVTIQSGEGIAPKIRDVSEEKRNKYPLRRVEIHQDNPEGIKPGIYFETLFTPDEWNRNSTPRWIVGGIIYESLSKTGEIPAGESKAFVEGIPEYEKGGKVVIRAEIGPKEFPKKQ